MEHLGHQYFEELKSRSFFQHSTNDVLGYTMHDLINDLAKSVAGEFSLRLDGAMDVSDMNEIFGKFLHFSLIGLGSGSFRKLKELQRAKRLRTFLLMSVSWEIDSLLDKVLDELLPELQLLRVVSVVDLTPGDFTRTCILSITKIPQPIVTLKHLRYLKFSHTKITCLPEQVNDLYNLQTLLVHKCHELSSLPERFTKLINLRHFGIDNNTPKVNKLPLGIGGLTSLQTLSKVMIEEANRFKISHLKGLSDLQGRLPFIGMDKVINPIQAKDAKLHQKKGLDVLEMKWSVVSYVSQNDMIEYEVLKELRPHPKLKDLKILYNKGTRFTSWVGDPSFDQLTELTLWGCKSTHLPTHGCLGSLRKLVVERMSEVKTVGFEIFAPTNSFLGIAFPSLQVLKFEDMQGWQRWSINSGNGHETPRSFPCLHEISMKCCPKLSEVSIGLIPSLRILHIEECSEAVLRSIVGLSLSLVELKMLNVIGLSQLYVEDLRHLGALEHLYIKKCDDVHHVILMISEPPVPKYLKQDELTQECKDLLSSLPIERGWVASTFYKYQGFWHPCRHLQGILSCRKHFEAQDKDTLLVTTPKSGTTWLKAILFTLMNHFRHSAHNHPLQSNSPHVLVPFLEVKLYLEHENPDFSSFKSPRLFSTHMPYVSLPKSIHDSKCKLVYLCRDPKDTLVSLWIFTNKLRLQEMGSRSLEEAFELFCGGVSMYGPFWDHVLGYWEESLKNPDKVFFLKYEDMKDEPVLHLRKLADFLGCPFSSEEEKEEVLEGIVELCSFDNLSNLKVNKLGKLPSGEDYSVFFRKGKVGDWKNYLTTEMVERLDRICKEKFEGSGLRF